MKWISINDQLPTKRQRCLFLINLPGDWQHRKIYGGVYTGDPDSKYDRDSFSIPGHGYPASHWCPIPETLLELPAEEGGKV
jgi:hypothetical protein